jgi:preprotein translocase subunit SecA
MFNKEDIAKLITEAAYAYFEIIFSQLQPTSEELINPEAAHAAKVTKILKDAFLMRNEDALPESPEFAESYKELIAQRSLEVAENGMARNQLISIIDMLWMTNLEDLDALQESVGLRAYGQRDPLVEYRQEASRLFKSFWGNFNAWIFSNIFKLSAGPVHSTGIPTQIQNVVAASAGAGAVQEKVGRNDLCPCGSGKKYKHCGLLNTEEHQRNMASGGKPKHEVTGG